jgi:hypothetical protein
MFRINTYKDSPNKWPLTIFRINTYEIHRGWGTLWLTRPPSNQNSARGILEFDWRIPPTPLGGARPGREATHRLPKYRRLRRINRAGLK